MCASVYVWLILFVYVWMCVCICVCGYVCVCIYVYVCVCVCMYFCLCAYFCFCAYVCPCVCFCAYVCVFVCLCICACVYVRVRMSVKCHQNVRTKTGRRHGRVHLLILKRVVSSCVTSHDNNSGSYGLWFLAGNLIRWLEERDLVSLIREKVISVRTSTHTKCIF